MRDLSGQEIDPPDASWMSGSRTVTNELVFGRGASILMKLKSVDMTRRCDSSGESMGQRAASGAALEYDASRLQLQKCADQCDVGQVQNLRPVCEHPGVSEFVSRKDDCGGDTNQISCRCISQCRNRRRRTARTCSLANPPS